MPTELANVGHAAVRIRDKEEGLLSESLILQQGGNTRQRLRNELLCNNEWRQYVGDVRRPGVIWGVWMRLL